MTGIVGIIGGGGWLGAALADQALRAKVLSPSSLIVSGRSPRGARLAQWPDVAWTQDNAELAHRSSIVLLSVRPENFGDLDVDLRGKLVISLMAGALVETIRQHVGADRIVRTMPNAAIEIGRCFTPWFAAGPVTDADRAFVRRLFATCGEEAEVETEQQLDYLTGLSGTSAAYPALLATAMIRHAVETGISEDVARKAVRGVIGACRLIDNDSFDPSKLLEAFLAYRGVTAAAVSTMMEKGLPAAVGAGLEAAARKSAVMAENTANAVATKHGGKSTPR